MENNERYQGAILRQRRRANITPFFVYMKIDEEKRMYEKLIPAVSQKASGSGG